MTARFLQWNARGPIGKWAEAKPMFINGSFHVLCLQETHFKENDRYNFNLPRYTLYNEYSGHEERRGGASIYVTNDLPHYRICLQTSLQAVACSIRIHNKRIAICSLYLPPSDDISVQDLSALIDQLPSPFLLCTDANSKHAVWGSSHTDRRGRIWMDVITQHALRVLNDGQATRIDESTGDESHIDLSLTSSDIAPYMDWNTDNDLHSSDHFPIHITMNNVTPFPGLPPVFLGWNTKKAQWTEFREHCNFHFDSEQGVTNCELITQAIVDCATMFIPARNGNGKYQCPWWTDECREAIRERRRAQNRLRRDRHSSFLRIEYRKQKAKTRQILRSAQLHSWHELLSLFNHRTPMNRLWEILRRFSHKTRMSRPFPVLIDNGVVIDDPVQVVNEFGRFFSDLSSRSNHDASFLRHEQTLVTALPDFGNDNCEDYNQPFTKRELASAIHRSGSTSVGPDQIHYEFLGHLNDSQINEILTLYNYLWTNDVFPEGWRHSYIIPILKPGKDGMKVTSYRPIQLTSCLCKVFERMIAKRMSWCLERYDLLSTHQCAFRQGRSTTDHLVRLDSTIRDGFLYHNCTLGIFLDIKSAYNMVSPTLLLHRLYYIGFRGHLLHFIQHYLSHRTFQVRCGVLSDVFQQEYGVVQGGVISPLLFNILIDSITGVIPRRVSIAIYADDCTIWVQGRNIPGLFRQIQQALNRIGEWSLQYGFTFSASKSKAVLFRRGRRRLDLNTLPLLKLNNETIPLEEHVKYLGIILDSRLNLSAHLDYIKGKAGKRLAILKSIAGKRFGADRAVLLRMYTSLVRPILEYGSQILDGPGYNRSCSLEPIQNAGLRIATGALRTSPVMALQVETNVLPLELRRKELLVRYYLKVPGDNKHQSFLMMDNVFTDTTYDGLSARYLQRVAGLPVLYRLKHAFADLIYDPPRAVAKPDGAISPWTLNDVNTLMLVNNKSHMSDADIVSEFRELIAKYPGYRLFFTDGSKMGQSVACAFTLNNAYFSYKLPDNISVYSAELFAILAALEYIRENRVAKALILTDSRSAIKALTSLSRDHPTLVHILELCHLNTRDGFQCSFVWIPGHRGITGNVRADYWAKKAHDKPTVTDINVGYREYLPLVTRRVAGLFARMWQNYRPTQLKLVKPDLGSWTSSVRKNRIEEVVLCRMRLGHTVLTHSHIMDRLPPPRCDTCGTVLHVLHILIECRRYRRERRDLHAICRHARVPMNIVSLLGDKDLAITDAVFAFLRHSNLLDKL